MKRLAMLLIAGVSVLAGCSRVEVVRALNEFSHDLDSTIAHAGAPVLDRVLPAEFDTFAITRNRSFGYAQIGEEVCNATVSKEHRKDWRSDDDGNLESPNWRTGADVTTLTAEKVNGHWQITSSDADPKRIDAVQFETRVSECVTGLEEQRKRQIANDLAEKKTVEHNLESWHADTSRPASDVWMSDNGKTR